MTTTRETMLAMLTDLSAKVTSEAAQEKASAASSAEVIAGLKAISDASTEVIKGLKDKVAALQLAVDDSVNFDAESAKIAEIEAAIGSISAPVAAPVPVKPPVVVMPPVPAEPTVVLPEPPIAVPPVVVRPVDPIVPPVVLPVV